MFRYEHTFALKYGVNDFDEAESYLNEDDMTLFLKGDSDIPGDLAMSVISIQWHMVGLASVKVTLLTERKMEGKELDIIMEWVEGQNSDGLGEGFEQQPFANYEYEDGDEDYEDFDRFENGIEYDFAMASFVPAKDEETFEFVGED